MSRNSPSLLALLGLVAVAGYQNRGRISEMLSDAQQSARQDVTGAGTVAGQPSVHGAGGGFLSEVARLFQPTGMNGAVAPVGSPVASALGDLFDRFRQNGRRDAMESWVSDRPNMPIDVRELEAVLGEDTLEELSEKTGMTRQELLLRLNSALPAVVDRFTPDGRLPTSVESASLA